MKQLISIVAIAILFMAGCDNKAADTSKKVTEASEEASLEVKQARQDAAKEESKASQKVGAAQTDYAKTDANAREKLTKAESEAMITKAQADFDVAMTEAEGRYNIAVEKCGAYKSVDKTACLSTAEAAFTADQAAVTANRDSALVQAEHQD